MKYAYTNGPMGVPECPWRQPSGWRSGGDSVAIHGQGKVTQRYDELVFLGGSTASSHPEPGTADGARSRSHEPHQQPR
jgi:hypothetical protein